MSVWLPDNPREQKVLDWLLGAALIAPLALVIPLWWRLYLSVDLRTWALAGAVMIGLATGGPLARRARHIRFGGYAGYGIHRENTLWDRLEDAFLPALLMTAVGWGWIVLTFAAVDIAVADRAERSFYVAEVHKCSGRGCAGCDERALLTMEGGFGTQKVCVEDVSAPVKVGRPLLIRGKFGAHAFFIFSVGHPASTPNRRP